MGFFDAVAGMGKGMLSTMQDAARRAQNMSDEQIRYEVEKIRNRESRYSGVMLTAILDQAKKRGIL